MSQQAAIFQAAADAGALDLRHQRSVASQHRPQRGQHVFFVIAAQRRFLEAELGELLDVAAGREVAAVTAHDDHAHLRRQCLDMRPQLAPHRC